LAHGGEGGILYALGEGAAAAWGVRLYRDPD
jgi:hypothetical protein